jgi:hypothetical protein
MNGLSKAYQKDLSLVNSFHMRCLPQPQGQLPSKGHRRKSRDELSCASFSAGWLQDLRASVGREQVDVPAVAFPVGAAVFEYNSCLLTSLSSAENRWVQEITESTGHIQSANTSQYSHHLPNRDLFWFTHVLEKLKAQ